MKGLFLLKIIRQNKKIKAKFKINDLVKTADLGRTFSKGDSTNWSHILYKITELINEMIQTYRIKDSPERYNEALSKHTKLTMKENKDVIKSSNLN